MPRIENSTPRPVEPRVGYGMGPVRGTGWRMGGGSGNFDLCRLLLHFADPCFRLRHVLCVVDIVGQAVRISAGSRGFLHFRLGGRKRASPALSRTIFFPSSFHRRVRAAHLVIRGTGPED